GNIEFLGRIDQQVKIRGFRIEPGEIENQLLKHGEIKDAFILAKEDVTGDKYLAAYFVSDKALPDAELREHLLKDLPDYMVPSYFVRLEKMPLTPSGKVDRKALPDLDLKTGEAYVAPRDEMEKKLVEIWAGILSRNGSQNPQNPIGIDDNFFRLGGHSLKATSLVSLVHKTLNVKIPLEEIFKRPTIRRLSDYINKAVTERFILIKPVEKKEYYALSSAQKRLYFLQQMDNAGTVYNMPSTWLLEGVPDKSHLENVFMKLIKRHESLRTSFDVIGEEPIQRIYRDATFEIEYNDLTTGVQDHLSSFIHHFVRAFDLSQAPLLRAGLVKIAAEKYVLAVDMHHIISDGTSMNIIIKDFMALYRREDLPELRVQYKDFSAWQGREKQGELIKRQEDYWVNEFAGEIPVLELPADYPRPPVQDFAGSSIHFEIDKQATAVLKRLALENDVTVYMILLAIYNVFLAKITNREDIVVGSPIAGRRHADLEKIIGMFVNTLALRNYVSTEKTFTGFLSDVKKKTLSAFENQDYPFEDLVERVVKNRDTSRNPVFDVMFVLQNMGMPEIVLEGLILKPYDYENKTAKFDLNLTGWEKEGKLSFDLEYSTKLFKKETALRLSGYFKNCIDAVRINPGAPIAGIEIMSTAEKEKILAISNGVTEPFDFTETIHGMFEKIALGNEDKTALVFKNARLTYGEFNRKADRLGWMLRQKGIGRDSVAGLMAERSFELVIGMVGIMKAGSAFLPIDPKLPNQRKRFMCEDSRMAVLLTNFKVENDIPGNIEIIDIRDEGGAKEENITAITPINQGADLAYVIFTSGSTGNPKGVMLEHSNLVNLIRFHHRCTGIDCRKVMQFATISFDASFHEIFSALLAGGELYLIDEETRNNIPSLLKYIGKNKIKTLFLPMAFLKIIFNDDDYVNTFPHCVEHIQTAGEQVVVSGKFKKYLQENNIYLHNHYGPSETHVITAFTVNPREDIPEFPSIGKPVMNTGIYILDKVKQLLPMGVAGELYAGGLQVGRGYLNNPELTDDKLKIKNEKLKIKNEKLYRTGDLARWLEDGNIEFLGRIDQQVKIRGIRVEPGEIESRLKKIALIKDAVVVVKQDASGEKYLCAYIVLSTGTDCNERELRNTLAIHLPEYMVPAYFVQLEKMPLTPSGKIDRKALPEPQVKTGESYTGPGNEIEKKLAAIWAEVLGQGTVSIGIDDNFFQLGGNSLKAIILLSKIHKVFEVKIPLPELFKHPRIRELAGYLKNAGSWKYESIAWVEKKEYYALSSAQKRLYFLQQIDAESTAYNLSSIMVFEGLVDKDKLAGAVAKLIRRHESFRTSFVIIAEEPVQRIHDEVEFEIDRSFAELFQKRLPEGPPEAIITSFIRPFDLAKAPLLRVGLVKLAEKHLFLVDMHHIISDGMSIQVLIQDFSNLYAGMALPETRYQYKDYAEWQNREKAGKKISEQKAYWQKEYEEEIPVLELPTDYARPLAQDFTGNNLNFDINSETYNALNVLALESRATLYMVLLSLYTIFLARLSNREDVVTGTPVAGRRHADLEKMIGMFVNMLALRYQPVGEKKFVYFLQEVKEKALRAFENQEYPYEDLVEILAVPRDLGRNPLFDTIFTLQNTGSQQIEIPGLKLVPGEFENKTAKFDLSLTAVEKD
ncbi:MAG TPA: amino acid adenylation domain-containing protein, partial [Candidatus Deferrimicrobium sp.]|nr:amino acid adenylation domain-containing protein [Candidatus Deferrimicrobium sp.]